MLLKKQKKIKHKKIALLIMVAIIGIGAYLLVAYFYKNWPFTVKNNTKSTVTSPPIKEKNKEDTKPAPQTPTGASSSEIPINQSLTANITQIEQKDKVITFAAEINNAKTSGQCVITFSNQNDRPVVRELATVSKANGTVTCGPLTISELEFSYLGEWNVELRYYENNSQVLAKATVQIK